MTDSPGRVPPGAALDHVIATALERIEIAKAFLHESGTDPEAWLDEAIDALRAALDAPPAAFDAPKSPNPCPTCGAFLWSDPRPCWNCARLAALDAQPPQAPQKEK